MKFSTTILPLGIALLAASVASAQTVPTAHAYQMGSENNRWGFVEWPVNNVSNLQIVKTTSSEADQIGAGEYVNGRYYAYTLYYDYLMGDGLEVADFAIYNPETFETIDVYPMQGTYRVVDMAYDYTTNTMYALREVGKADNHGTGKTALCIVDLTNGKLTLVGDPGNITALDGYGREVPESLVALASHPTTGQLYAMGEYRQLYTLDSFSGKATPVGQRHRIAVMNDFQSMAFTPDGKLYYCQAHPDYEYFMEINPTDGSLTNPVTGEAVTVDASFNNNAARIPNDPQLTGLWFDGKQYVTSVPAAVSNLKAVTLVGKPNEVKISWTLPSLNADGSQAQVTGVNVYRLGTSEPIATLGAEATSFTDPDAPNGDLFYLVAPQCASGAGFPAWTGVFAGADQLTSVTNLTAVLVGDMAQVEWDAPSATVNGGYADFDAITYNVVRIKGSEETTVAAGLTETGYEAELDGPGSYSFRVIPFSGGIEGLPEQSNEITLEAGAITLPYACGFEDNDGGTLWTIANQSTGSYGWSIVTGYAYQQYSGKFAQFKTGGSSTFPANDWLISPAIECPAGALTLSFWANGASFDTHTFAIYAGPADQDAETYTDRIYYIENEKIYDDSNDSPNHYKEITVPFTLAEAGQYCIAFKGIGASTYATLKIDSLSLTASGSVGVGTPSQSPASTEEYYNLQGQRISEPTGICIRVTPNGAEKVIR